MSELKVNTINPASGTSLQFGSGASLVVIGNSGSNAQLMISSATGESVPNTRFDIYCTDGTIKSAYGYKDNTNGVEILGTASKHPLQLMTDNTPRLTIAADTPSSRIGIGMTPISGLTGQIFAGAYNWNDITSATLYNSDTGKSAGAFFTANNLVCSGIFGIYGTGHTFANQVAMESDSNSFGGIRIGTNHWYAPIRFFTSKFSGANVVPTERVTIGAGTGLITIKPGSLIAIDNPTDSGATSSVYYGTGGAVQIAGGMSVTKTISTGGLSSGSTICYGGLTSTGTITTAGLTSSALLSCAIGPTQGQHLANKGYVDSQGIGGTGQAWQTFTVGTQRVNNTIYTNSTGRPIAVAIRFITAGDFYVDNIQVFSFGNISNLAASSFCIVPNGSTYKTTLPTTNSPSIALWAELR